MVIPAQKVPSSASAQHAQALTESLAATLHLARALVAARRNLDLAGLDQEAGRLCAAILDLPPAEGLALRPRLISLLADLDALSADLAEAAGDVP
ncbi:hypothetical protein [Rhodovastum atsumiense]|uniref:Uncharacterized protein n=1 Tax=Rhodovastum atsumiense TaxID=504468 RepID=A0A5M6IS37_9PROT|nr:hypothetical protein [Rhodovastum atsumiense]KAA5611116.1 hypothetical protein F1189_16105 [Rhodovastum atsumiense]